MVAEIVDKSFARRLSLNRQILKNRYWMLPVDVGHSNYMPVGRGVRSSIVCGRWRSFSVCKNVEGHKGVFLGGMDCTGKVVVAHNHMWCHKSSCPVCFIRGWSVRASRSIVGRLDKGVMRGLGKVEHILVSVPIVERGFSESVLRVKCRKALFDRGIHGGVMIFHGFREDRRRDVLVWSPHYHCLGFILGGFDRCRECVHSREDCYSCDGLKGKESRGFRKDGYIVKVFDERERQFSEQLFINFIMLLLGLVLCVFMPLRGLVLVVIASFRL